jgi:FtsZ-binding cell division protein ZapB
MAMRLVEDHGVGLLRATVGGSLASMVAAVQWFGDGGALAAVGTLIGVVVAAFLAVIKSLFSQVKELRADNQRLREELQHERGERRKLSTELEHERDARHHLEDRIDELTRQLLGR